jgi:8-amino-7-oxononanoate synthase
MVDDAHGVGVLGATGRGCAECCAEDPRKIDIWMGTLSKTLASCGGYIAGDRHLIEILKYTAPGFVYSVGLLPAMAATALASLRLLKTEPERVQRLQANGRLFLQEAREATLDTGNSLGFGMLPVMVGGLARTAKVADRLFARGINVSFIVYPGVPINSGRVRFFLTSEHTPEEIRFAVRAAKDGLNRWW